MWECGSGTILSWLRLSWTLSVCQTFSFCGHHSPHSIIIRNMTPKIFQFCSVCNIFFVEQTQTPNHDHISGSRRLISPCDLNCYPYFKMFWWYFKCFPFWLIRAPDLGNVSKFWQNLLCSFLFSVKMRWIQDLGVRLNSVLQLRENENTCSSHWFRGIFVHLIQRA